MGQIKELEFLLGKRVKISQGVDVCYMHKKANVVGILTFVGKNSYLNIPLQATVGRMPITLTSLKQIELLEDE